MYFRCKDMNISIFKIYHQNPIFLGIFGENVDDLDRMCRYLMVYEDWKQCYMIDNKDIKCQSPRFYWVGGL